MVLKNFVIEFFSDSLCERGEIDIWYIYMFRCVWLGNDNERVSGYIGG